MTGTLSFGGLGPYVVPVSQSSKAIAAGTTVELHIRFLVDGNRMETLLVPMSADQAVELAGSLGMAAGEALRKGR
jgi:hypothetical protein